MRGPRKVTKFTMKITLELAKIWGRKFKGEILARDWRVAPYKEDAGPRTNSSVRAGPSKMHGQGYPKLDAELRVSEDGALGHLEHGHIASAGQKWWKHGNQASTKFSHNLSVRTCPVCFLGMPAEFGGPDVQGAPEDSFLRTPF
eukprot:410414-Pelagomonas_calceolata.AAC.1